MQVSVPVHEALRRVYDDFEAATAINAPRYLSATIGIGVSQAYQIAESNGGDEARRRVSLQDAILITNTLNAARAERELPKDYGLIRAACAAVGLVAVEPSKARHLDEHHIPRITAEFNDLVQAFYGGVADGTLSTSDVSRIRREAYELIEAAESLVADVEEQVQPSTRLSPSTPANPRPATSREGVAHPLATPSFLQERRASIPKARRTPIADNGRHADNGSRGGLE